MTQNTIEIEVELKGQKDALKGLDQVKEGAEGIGETFKGVGDIVGKTNKQMGESLNAVSNAVGESAAAFQGMRDAISSIATGSVGITTLLGPLALLTTAIGAAYEAYRQLSGAAREAEIQQEAMAAASADLTSKLEQLAEKGIGYAKAQLLDYVRANLQAQMMKELLEKRTEASLGVLQAEARQNKEAQKAALEYAKALKDQSSSYQERVIAETRMKEAFASQQIVSQRTKKVFSDLADEMIKVNAEVESAAKRFKALEETTDEGLKTKLKELTTRRASLEALKAETDGLDEASRLTALHNAERVKTVTLNDVEKFDRTQLKALIKAQNIAIEALNETSLQEKKLALDIAKATAEKTVARKVETKAIDQQKLAQQALREEQMRLVKESQIRQLDIKLTEEGYAQQIALAQERYELGLALAQEDALQREIVKRQHDLAVKQIEDQRLAREQQVHDRSLEMLMSRLQAEDKAHDAQLARQKRVQDEQIKLYKDFFSQYEKGLAQAAVANILFGDSFEEAAAGVLKSLAIEAGARALMELAAGTGALALGSPTAAAHFKSAGIFGAAAVAARAGAGVLGGGAGGGATGGTTASPTGAPQVATAPQREQAESREMVFNLNFGGAVIYDTKEAAKRAMIGDIVRTYNGNNRGMPRFNFAR